MAQQVAQPAVFDIASLLPPFHEIELPTKGMYDSSIPATVHVRGLTVKELKHITANGRLDKRVFDTTLKACVKENIDISSLLIEDYNYLVYMIRLFSSGSKITAATRCSNEQCGKQFGFDYDISECSLVEHASEPVEKFKTVDLPRFLEQGYKVQVEVKRLTRNDMLLIERSIKQAMDMAAKLGTPSNVFPLIEYLKAFVVSITGFPVPIPKEQVLDVLSGDDANLVTSAFASTSFGVKGEAHPVCPICGTENTYEIPFTDAFFL